MLVSETTRALLPAELPGGAEIIDLGQHSLKDLERAEHLFQIVVPGLRSDFPPPRADPAGGRKEDLERRIDEFVNRGLSSVFERFDLEKMESGRWLLKRRDDRTT